jgi:sec-independent protein translocase protein TatC
LRRAAQRGNAIFLSFTPLKQSEIMALDQIDVDKPETEKGKEMSFLEHLEELRWHVIRALVAIVLTGIVIWFFQGWLFEKVIFGPTHKDFLSYRVFCWLSHALYLGDTMCIEPPEFRTQAIGFGEAFITSIKVSFLVGFIVAFPYVFYQFWSFIRPGLYPKEQKAASGAVFTCSALFLLGVLFGYYVISPFAVKFLAGYTIPGVENQPTLSSLINYMIMFTAPAGLIFELPVVVYFLSKIGLVTPEDMRKYRRHSIIGVLLLAALLTPPDVVTQFLIAIPLTILYEFSIIISARVAKAEAEAEAREEAETRALLKK